MRGRRSWRGARGLTLLPWSLPHSPRRLKGPSVKALRARRGPTRGPAGPRVPWESTPCSQTTMIWATTRGPTCFKVRPKGKGGGCQASWQGYSPLGYSPLPGPLWALTPRTHSQGHSFHSHQGPSPCQAPCRVLGMSRLQAHLSSPCRRPIPVGKQSLTPSDASGVLIWSQ